MTHPNCKCSMTTRLVGDGCQWCNPEKAADIVLDELAELRAYRDRTEAALREDRALTDALTIATCGRSYPNCDIAVKAAAKIADGNRRRIAEEVVRLARDWIDQSYKVERLEREGGA